jgi:lipopolysaccharide transport system ATP-binding protein
MNTAIKVTELSKIYRLGEIGTGTISHDLERWWAMKIRRQDDPFLKVGEINDRSKKGNNNIVYSLKDINFEIKQGEAVGILGRNGAGKSTLLKILSRVTSPSSGCINIKGRVASLLEVGTGFHPELTGRENIYLNGAILGMRKKEITRKLDAIIDFSGVERYIDTPVKRYSSGMYVRLAFAVAAHLESEILVVDEVLAVGDAEFQKKCLGKMDEVSHTEGRTVLFVSHNLAAVKELCNTAILLKNGEVEATGLAGSIIKNYLSQPIKISNPTDLINDYKSRRGNGEARFTEININNNSLQIDPTEEIKISFVVKILQSIDSLYFYLNISDPLHGGLITETKYICLSENTLSGGSNLRYEITIEKNILRTGLFPLYLWLGKNILETDYPYDILDRVYFLNLDSEKKSIELGYNSAQPNGVFNLRYKVEKC